MRICSGPGCGRSVVDDVRFCDTCKAERQPPVADGINEHTYTDRVRYGALYKSRRWEQLRALIVREQPQCARCRSALTEIVDHVVPAGVAIIQAKDSGRFRFPFAGFFIRTNLQGLCRACHYRKTLEDKTHTGDWPSVLLQQDNTPRRMYTF